VTHGSVRLWLRIEAAVVCAASVWVYAQSGRGWGLFAALILVPDASLAGYLGGLRVGAAVYNAVHSYAAPLLLALCSAATGHGAWVPFFAIWTAHNALDRAVGYGLKYPTSFGETHLGPVGRRPSHT
jgi:hypothetical protein